MEFKSLEELLINELHELYNAEKQLVEGMPKLYEAASTIQLKETFKKHLLETKEQVKRLETIFEHLDIKKSSILCPAMKGLIAESNEIATSTAPVILKDAGLIGAMQKIKHYEIASYGTAIAHAKILDLVEIAQILHTNLEEDASVDKKLTEIAEGSFFVSGVNRLAIKKQESISI